MQHVREPLHFPIQAILHLQHDIFSNKFSVGLQHRDQGSLDLSKRSRDGCRQCSDANVRHVPDSSASGSGPDRGACAPDGQSMAAVLRTGTCASTSGTLSCPESSGGTSNGSEPSMYLSTWSLAGLAAYAAFLSASFSYFWTRIVQLPQLGPYYLCVPRRVFLTNLNKWLFHLLVSLPNDKKGNRYQRRNTDR